MSPFASMRSRDSCPATRKTALSAPTNSTVTSSCTPAPDRANIGTVADVTCCARARWMARSISANSLLRSGSGFLVTLRAIRRSLPPTFTAITAESAVNESAPLCSGGVSMDAPLAHTLNESSGTLGPAPIWAMNVIRACPRMVMSPLMLDRPRVTRSTTMVSLPRVST